MINKIIDLGSQARSNGESFPVSDLPSHEVRLGTSIIENFAYDTEETHANVKSVF